MAVIVALLAFALLWRLWHRKLLDWRDAFLSAASSWGAILVVMTEVLSRVTRITFGWVLAGWIVVVAALAFALWRVRQTRKNPSAEERPKDPDANHGVESTLAWAMLTPLGVIGATLAMVAWKGPPSNFDAMVYHMARILHWIQDRNVAFYPTAIPRQLEMSPGAEYILLHMQILAGGDQLANLVQWFAWCGCIIGASAVARSLGAKPVGQIIAALVAGTLPMACLQATTTQNDLVAALWVTVFFWSVLRALAGAADDNPAAHWLNMLLCGMSLGLAMLTKTTDFIYAAPAVVALTGGLLWRRTWRAPVPLLAVAVLAVALNTPFFLRNMHFTHTILGNGGRGLSSSDVYINSTRGVGTTVSNYLRNAGVEMMLPSDDLTGDIERAIRAVHRWLGLDPDDQATTWQLDIPGFQLRAQLWNTEDNASNPAQFALIILATVLIAFHPRSDWQAVAYAAGIFIAITAFCFELRWQEWNARLHLPIMVASAPLVGIALERHMNRKLALVLATLLPWLSVPVIAENYNHPLAGSRSIYYFDHDTRYFLSHPAMQYQFRDVVDVAVAHHCRQVGLVTQTNDWEYPLDMMLLAKLPDVRIEFYPGPTTLRPDQVHTHNKGWDDALRPYIVVKVSGESATVVKIVDQ